MIIMFNKLKNLIIILAVFLIIGGSSFYISINAQSIEQFQKLEPVSLDQNITIPDDYPTIQEGINNSNPGDLIFVRSGVYKENIVIDKEELHLLGEDKFNTVIDIENNAGDAVVISADGVTFESFTIANARYKEKQIWYQSGILIFTSNVTIKNNIISDNRLGLMSYTTAYNLTVCDNMFFYDGFFPACYIQCINGECQGTDNIPMESIFLNVTNNTVNGRPLYYLKNVHDTVVGTDAGQVILVNCTNITVKNLYLLNIDFSIMLYYCSNCTIENSTIVNADGELILFFSENNTIQNITAINAFHGTCLDLGSKNNIVRYNQYYDSLQGITVMTLCNGNRIYGNKIHNNDLGMKIISVTKNLPAHDNFVYENEFYKNDVAISITIFEDPSCYTYNNTIINNSFFKNNIGIHIYLSNGNIIKNNTFQKNSISAVFRGRSQNIWHNNYWNRPRILPKIIFGYKMMFNKIPIPCWLNIDKHPAKKPHEI